MLNDYILSFQQERHGSLSGGGREKRNMVHLEHMNEFHGNFDHSCTCVLKLTNF
jgi:hypothetical protein